MQDLFSTRDWPGLVFDRQEGGEDKDWSRHLIRKEDIYRDKFFNEEHFNYHGTEDGNVVVVSALSKPKSFGVYSSLVTKGTGYEEFDTTVSISDCSIEEGIERGLKSKYNIKYIDDPDFPSQLLTVEQKHPQSRTAMKIGLVCCKSGQTAPVDMFANGKGESKCSDKFWKFVHYLGEPIDITDDWKKYRGDMRPPGKAFYTVWNKMEVIYHVAPILNDEETRRLIGNDIAMLFFLEEGEDGQPVLPFDPKDLDKFGNVPQTFALVTPVGNKYRVGFWRKSNLDTHPPLPPVVTLDLKSAKDIILTKLHNGLITTNYCSPMKRLFSKPRQDTVDSITLKYRNTTPASRTPLKKKLSSYSVGKTQVQTQRKKNATLTYLPDAGVNFILNATLNPVNALVLLVASNIAYEEPEQIKLSANTILGFEHEKVFVVGEKLVTFYIAADVNKVFIVFRGIADQELGRRMMDKAKKAKLRLNKQDITLPGEIQADIVKAVTSVYDKIESYLIDRFFRASQKLYIVGHDFGGAIAIVLAHLLSFSYKEITSVYTYGSCKIGDSLWAKSYPDWLAAKTFRIAHSTDYMPGLPGMGWEHVGQLYSPENSSTIISEPHSVESYFTTLLPGHKAMLGEEADRIEMKAPSIQLEMKNRETTRFDSAPSLSESAPTWNKGTLDQNTRYSRVHSQTNVVRLSHHTLPQNIVPTPQPVAPATVFVDSIVAPNILQQIRNNTFCVLSQMKLIKPLLSDLTPDNIQALHKIISEVQKHCRNLVILKDLLISQNPIVNDLAQSIQKFSGVSSRFFHTATNLLVAETLSAFQDCIVAAGEVVKNCERCAATHNTVNVN